MSVRIEIERGESPPQQVLVVQRTEPYGYLLEGQAKDAGMSPTVLYEGRYKDPLEGDIFVAPGNVAFVFTRAAEIAAFPRFLKANQTESSGEQMLSDGLLAAQEARRLLSITIAQESSILPREFTAEQQRAKILTEQGDKLVTAGIQMRGEIARELRRLPH